MYRPPTIGALTVLVGERLRQHAWQCYMADCTLMLANAWYKELKLERYSEIVSQARKKPDIRTKKQIFADLIGKLKEGDGR